MDDGQISFNISNISRRTGQPKDVVIATIDAHTFSGGDSAYVTGVSSDDFNDTYTINSVTATNILYAPNSDVDLPSGNPDESSATASTVNVTITVDTTVAHNLSVSDNVTIAWVTPTIYNGGAIVTTVVDSDTFQFDVPTQLSPITDSFSAKVVITDGTTVYVTTSIDHGFLDDSYVKIAQTSPANYSSNQQAYQITVTGLDTFSFAAG